MTTRTKKIAWLSFIPALVLVAGIVASFVRVQVYASNANQQLTNLEEKYVPRTELDHRMESIQSDVTDIKEGVERIERLHMNND
jgi:hypothetical protein